MKRDQSDDSLFPHVGVSQRSSSNHLEFEIFNLTAESYPEVTKNLLPIEFLLKFGLLPLGFKKSLFGRSIILNIGVVSSKHEDALERLQDSLRTELDQSNIDRIRIFSVRLDEYLSIMTQVYGIRKEGLRTLSPSMLEPTILRHLLGDEPAPAIELSA